MKKNHTFFENKECEHYPCHDLEKINCLFCFCLLYGLKECIGDPEYLKGENKRDCSDCTFPHERENYGEIIDYLGEDLDEET